jgi:hypothetical protein
MQSEPSFWRVECTADCPSSEGDSLDDLGRPVEWETVADNVTEHHHATRLRDRSLYGGDEYRAPRTVPVWVEERTGEPDTLRR